MLSGGALEMAAARLRGGTDVEAGKAARGAALETRGLSYALPAREVLSNVDCYFPSGRLSAVMGASGSGKTGLLTLFRGLFAPGSRVEGEVLCDGQPVSAELMRTVVSVVPQEDVFLAALTPRETLRFAAELRLPAAEPAAARESMADEVIKRLRLESCADTAIGDAASGHRGISGGERRRLSVAMAIIGGLPRALLCDEPTSGLDSKGAELMVGLLKSMADSGVTVVCTIHQPSFSLFQEFAYLLLLDTGRVCYAGEVAQVEAHFRRFGAATPAHTNPASHYVEAIQQAEGQWAKHWQETLAKRHRGLMPVNAAKLPQQSPTVREGKSQLTVAKQTAILTRRAMLENFKGRGKFVKGLMSRLPASTMVGVFFWRVASSFTQGSIFPVKGIILLAVQNPLIETFYAGANTFQGTKGLLKREYYEGLYRVTPYYLAYYTGFLAMQVPWTFASVAPMYVLTGLPLELQRFGLFILSIFLIVLMSCAAGSAVGAVTRDSSGNRAVLSPMLIIMMLFSGYVIPYEQIPEVWKPLYFVSPIQWAMTICQYAIYQGVDFVDCDAVTRASGHCFATGNAYLDASTNKVARALGIGGMLALLVAYLLVFLALNVYAIHRRVLDGRV